MCFNSSVMGALFSKLKGPGFKFWPGTVGGPVTITMWSARQGLKTSFEVNTVTEENK